MNENVENYNNLIREIDEVIDDIGDKLYDLSKMMDDIELEQKSDIEDVMSDLSRIHMSITVWWMGADDVLNEWNDVVRPHIAKNVSATDVVSFREGFSNYIDGLQKAGEIPEFVADNIENPE